MQEPEIPAVEITFEYPAVEGFVDKFSSTESKHDQAHRSSVEDLKKLLEEMTFYDLKPTTQERVFERDVFKELYATKRFSKQTSRNRVSAFGAMHKPDGVFDDCVALEIKKISGVGGITHALQRVIGQAMLYTMDSRWKAAVVLILDFTGKVSNSIEIDPTKNIKVELEKQNIHFVIRAGERIRRSKNQPKSGH